MKFSSSVTIIALYFAFSSLGLTAEKLVNIDCYYQSKWITSGMLLAVGDIKPQSPVMSSEGAIYSGLFLLTDKEFWSDFSMNLLNVWHEPVTATPQEDQKLTTLFRKKYNLWSDKFLALKGESKQVLSVGEGASFFVPWLMQKVPSNTFVGIDYSPYSWECDQECDQECDPSCNTRSKFTLPTFEQKNNLFYGNAETGEFVNNPDPQAKIKKKEPDPNERDRRKQLFGSSEYFLSKQNNPEPRYDLILGSLLICQLSDKGAVQSLNLQFKNLKAGGEIRQTFCQNIRSSFMNEAFLQGLIDFINSNENAVVEPYLMILKAKPSVGAVDTLQVEDDLSREMNAEIQRENPSQENTADTKQEQPAVSVLLEKVMLRIEKCANLCTEEQKKTRNKTLAYLKEKISIKFMTSKPSKSEKPYWGISGSEKETNQILQHLRWGKASLNVRLQEMGNDLCDGKKMEPYKANGKWTISLNPFAKECNTQKPRSFATFDQFYEKVLSPAPK